MSQIRADLIPRGLRIPRSHLGVRCLAGFFLATLLYPVSLSCSAAEKPDIPARIDRGVAFLTNAFETTLNLLPEYPGSSVYWLFHDNYLAAKILDHPRPDLSQKIREAMAGFGVTNSGKIELLFEEARAPLPFRNFVLTNIAESGGRTIRTERVVGIPLQGWRSYADLQLFAAISLARSKPAEARSYLQAAEEMWDGTGFLDPATKALGHYSAYKIALFLIADQRLAVASPLRKVLLSRLLAQQDDEGGFVTDYRGDGFRVGRANVETTCLALLALGEISVPANGNEERAGKDDHRLQGGKSSRTDHDYLPRQEDFTQLWWADGPPYYLTMSRTPWMPTLCLRSGGIGAQFDVESLRFTHAGRFKRAVPESASLSQVRDSLIKLPPLPFSAEIQTRGKFYRCVGKAAWPVDPHWFPIQFVESGRNLQHVVIDALEFVNDQGQRLEASARLELAFWPDRLSATLHVHSGAPADASLVLASGARAVKVSLNQTPRATLPLIEAGLPGADLDFEAEDVTLEWNDLFGAWMAHLPVKPWANREGTPYPETELDRLDSWTFRIRNNSPNHAAVPIVFSPKTVPSITGFTPYLADADGLPIGIPVQLSKNWHTNPKKGELTYQGPWIHACSYLRVPPRSERTYQLRITHARYGGVFAASHAQLSLIGWGHNQFWDQAALGSFGESICYEPGRVQRRCLIDDLRPFMTLDSPQTKRFGWSGNAGGGDFLMWIDATGHYRGFRATRTQYRAHGPCLSDVQYDEETTGGEVRARMRVMLGRTDDYVRALHRVRYDIHAPVRWNRLAFYQLGADYYNSTPARLVAYGNRHGMLEEWAPVKGADVFDRVAIPLKGPQPWVSVHGLERPRLGQGEAAASRGLVIRSWKARMSGRNVETPHVSTFATEWGKGNHKTVIELSPPPGVSQLQPGDYLEADLELLVFPADTGLYYGPNLPFQQALTGAPDSWQLIHREAAQNEPDVVVKRGKLVGRYPLTIAVSSGGDSELSIRGGLGYLPVVFTGLKDYRGYGLRVNGKLLQQDVHGADSWQVTYDADQKRWSKCYNVPVGFAPVVLTVERTALD